MSDLETVKAGSSRTSGLTQGLRFHHVCAIIMGTMIGSGIFKKAGPMAALLGSAPLMIGVWIFAGLITLFGALSLAEIAAMWPATGGQYKYYQRMYGKAFAFLSGWSIFSVIQSGSIAAIAYVFSDYANSVLPLWQFPQEIVSSYQLQLPLLGTLALLENAGQKILSSALILLLSAINVQGVRSGGAVSAMFTTLKVGAMLAIIALCLGSSSGSVMNFSSTAPNSVEHLGIITALSLALSKAFWAYDGWSSISFVGGEIHNPQRTLPRALLISVSAVMLLYLLINCAYIYVLPLGVMAQSSLVAADAVRQVLGASGAAFIALAVMVSTFGATNGTILNSARVYFAMAQDALFFRSLAAVHPQKHTPHVALWTQAAWSLVLLWSGSFETLTDMLIFVSWIFYAMSVVGVFVLRKKMPDTPRPYRVWGYPFVPLAFIVVAGAFVFTTLWGDITAFANNQASSIPSLNGVLITLSGIPFYWWFSKRAQKNTSA